MKKLTEMDIDIASITGIANDIKIWIPSLEKALTTKWDITKFRLSVPEEVA